MFCGRCAPASKSLLHRNRFIILAILLDKSRWCCGDRLLDWKGCGFDLGVRNFSNILLVAGFSLKQNRTFFGNLSSGNPMTWVSEFGSEISILLWKRTSKIFCLGCALVDFGKCRFILAGVKSYNISSPLLRVMSVKMTQNDNQGAYSVLCVWP